MSDKKHVTIEITASELEQLKSSNYRLCFAKKVGEHFNVVWTSHTDFLANNHFHWTPHYQVFGSNIFKDGVTVQTSTNKHNITLGQEAKLNESGVIEKPHSGPNPDAITLNNDYGPIHPGVSQRLHGPDGVHMNPIYVAEHQVQKGTTKLTPKEEILVWFEQDVETSTMISHSVSRKTKIDMTQQTHATRKYKNGKWITPAGDDVTSIGTHGADAVANVFVRIWVATAFTLPLWQIGHAIRERITERHIPVGMNIQSTPTGGAKIEFGDRPDDDDSEEKFAASLIQTAPESLTTELTNLTLNELALNNISYHDVKIEPLF